MGGYIATAQTDEWETPQDLFDRLNEEFHFDLDPCATKENAKCKNFFTKEDNGLNKEWFGNVFINPPFKQVAEWVEKAYDQKKNNTQIKTIVMLIASRTDTRWFHNYIYNQAEVRFVKGRVKYKLNGKESVAPFPSMIVIFK